MHVANIFLFGMMTVLIAFLANLAFAACKNASWTHYEHCLAPPPGSDRIFNERERHKRKAGRLLGVTFAVWLSMLSVIAIESQAAVILVVCGILSVSSIPLCRAMAELRREDGLNEADLRLYRAVDALSEHRLARVYLDAIRESGRGWVTKIEVERLKALVREDEFRVTRQHCLSARPGNGKDEGTDQGAQPH